MRLVLTVVVPALMLSGCAQWPSNKGPQRYALAGHPGVTCLDRGNKPGMHIKADPVCQTESQWAAQAREVNYPVPMAAIPNGPGSRP